MIYRILLATCYLFITAVISPLFAQTLVVGGTGTDLGTFRLLVDAFEEKHPHVEIIILPSMGSSGGIKALKHQKISLALTSRPLKNTEHSPEIKAIHAGLETSIIGAHFGGMDMISIGPQIEFPHSPDERVEIPSVKTFWDYLLALLARL